MKDIQLLVLVYYVQSSTLYANNLTKFITSIGPFTTGKKGVFYLDHENDPVVR